MNSVRSAPLFVAPEKKASTPRELILAALVYPAVLAVSALAKSTPLPFDRQFGLVVYLMWSGSSASVSLLQSYLFHINELICLAGLALLLAAAILPARMLRERADFAIRRVYRYALALPLFYLLVAHLSRYVASLVYIATPYVHWNFTPMIARVETPMIVWLQNVLAGPTLSALFSTIYSFAWSVGIMLIGLGLVLADRPQLMNRAITGFFLISILAVPLYILFPVYDPWTTNPLYHNPGIFSTHIQYLYPNASTFMLSYINNDYNKWATAYCLPSLHVGFPLMFYFITRRGGLRAFSNIFLALSVLTGFAVLYLGRHWLVDVLLAVPFAYGIARLTEKIHVDFTLGNAAEQPSSIS